MNRDLAEDEQQGEGLEDVDDVAGDAAVDAKGQVAVVLQRELVAVEAEEAVPDEVAAVPLSPAVLVRESPAGVLVLTESGDREEVELRPG